MVKLDNLQLRFNKEIEINKFKIKSPTVRDIVDIGEEKYRKYLIPFTTSKEILNYDDEILKDIKDFDLFFIKTSEGKYVLEYEEMPFISILLDSLEFYFKEKALLLTGKDLKYGGIVDFGYPDDVLSNIFFILIENNGIIDRDNFDDIADMILKINYAKKMKVDKPPEFKNERQRDIYNKIMEGRRRKAEKESETFADMIDVVQFGGKSFVRFDEIEKFTVQQLIHSYITILSIDNFNINFGQYQAGVDPKDLDLDHWTKKIKQK